MLIEHCFFTASAATAADMSPNFHRVFLCLSNNDAAPSAAAVVSALSLSLPPPSPLSNNTKSVALSMKKSGEIYSFQDLLKYKIYLRKFLLL